MLSITKSVLLVSLLASTSQAGEVLKLKSGAVKPADIQKRFSNIYSSNKVTEWIVQFKTPITAQIKKSFTEKGIEVFGYLPEDALVVRANLQALQGVLALNNQVNAYVPYSASYKINADVGVLNIFNQNSLQAFFVKTFKSQETTKIAEQISAMNSDVTIHDMGGKVISVVMPKNLVPMVAALTGVEHIQSNVQFIPMNFVADVEQDPMVKLGAGDYTDIDGTETGTRVMKFDAAWAQGFAGKNQIASMADTGLDSGDAQNIHADFAGGVTKGFVFGLFGKSWNDPMGHGTHVAGSVMGRGAASGGRLRGGAYEAQMIAEGMWSPMLNNLSVPSKIQDLFSKAYAEGARIHTNSWGAARGFGEYDTMASQVDEFMYNNPDMLILFAAGNSGVDKDKDGRIDPNSIGSPGTAKNVLTVGASENNTATGGIQVPISKLRSAKDAWPAEPIFSSKISDNENGIAMFSSRGPTNDGRVKPEIVAPGTNILSNRSQVPGANELWGAYNKDYVWSGGTSMSTPLTAGAATIVRQVLQQKWQQVNPSAALIKAVMMHSADDLFPGQYGMVGKDRGQELLTRRPNSDEGYGRVDMDNVVKLDSATTTLVDNKQGVAQSAQEVYQFTANSSFNFTATLAWTDAPASANAAQTLVNDLDLILVTPSGSQISMNDHTNNNELIEQANLPAGAYKLIVKGVKVPQTKGSGQPFALVYSIK